MRILFVVPYAPTPIRTRPYNLLRGLAGRGHTLTLATLWQGAEEQAALRQWQQMGVRVAAAHLSKARSLWNLAVALPGTAPLQASYCWQPALLRQLAAVLDQAGPETAPGNRPFDVIHVEHLRGARYALWLQERLQEPAASGGRSRRSRCLGQCRLHLLSVRTGGAHQRQRRQPADDAARPGADAALRGMAGRSV